MATQRKQYSAECKARVELEGLKGLKTVNELASRLFLPNPRQCKISRAWERLTDRNALCMQGDTVRVRYTHTGRQGQNRKLVNIESIT